VHLKILNLKDKKQKTPPFFNDGVIF